MHSNFTDVRTVKESDFHLQYKLKGLGKDNIYFSSLKMLFLLLLKFTFVNTSFYVRKLLPLSLT